MAELKTKVNNASVTDFLNKIENETKRKDCFEILKMIKSISKEDPKMWGDSIIGFGTYDYTYATGRTGSWPQIGFSPRVKNITLYIMSGFTKFDELLEKLGKHKTGKSCLYINSLNDIDIEILKDIITNSISYVKQKKIDYGEC